MNARDVKDALIRRHQNAGTGAWVCVEEALSGYAAHDTGGIDLLALGVWQTARVAGLRAPGRAGSASLQALGVTIVDTRFPLVAYEVKVSRSDFRRELYGYRPKSASRGSRGVPPWPGKAQAALDRAQYFVFAVPAGLLHPWEIARSRPWTEPDDADVVDEVLEAPVEVFEHPALFDAPAIAPPVAAVPLSDRAPDPLPKGALYVPNGCGLVEVDERGACHVRRHAVPHPAKPLTRHETHEVMRRLEADVERRTRRAIREARRRPKPTALQEAIPA